MINYNANATVEKLSKIRRFTEEVFVTSKEKEVDAAKSKMVVIDTLGEEDLSAAKKINVANLNRAVSKTENFVNELNDYQLNITPDQHDHFLHVAKILKDLIEIQQDIIKLEIERIDPQPPGFASRKSNQISRLLDYLKGKVGFDKNDEKKLLLIIKTVFKPINSFIGIFKAITPDKWRVATTKERIYLGTGLVLTLLGIACIIAAVVLSVTTPVGAVVAGIGITVAYGSIGLGLAAMFCLGIGGVFLGTTGKDLSKTLGEKQELKKMKNTCDQCIKILDDKMKQFKKATPVLIEEPEFKPRNTLLSSSPSVITKKLQEVSAEILTLNNKTRPSV